MRQNHVQTDSADADAIRGGYAPGSSQASSGKLITAAAEAVGAASALRGRKTLHSWGLDQKVKCNAKNRILFCKEQPASVRIRGYFKINSTNSVL
jgi:hypothetical protein